MKFLSLLSVGLFCTGSILFLRSLRSEKIEQSVHAEDVDLGIVEQGQTVPFAFRVANATSRPIEVVEVVKSCGCTLIQDRKGVRIKPGESLAIEATLDTTGRRGPIEIGSTLAYRWVEGGSTRAEGRPQQLLMLVRVDVRPTLRMFPDSVTFATDGPAGDSPIQVVAVDSKRLDSFRLLGCETSAGWLRARLAEPLFSRDGDVSSPARIEISVDPAALAAEDKTWLRSDHTVRVRTTVEADPVLVLPVRIQVSEAGRVP